MNSNAHDREIGVLEKQAEIAETRIETLFTSNEKRKKEISENAMAVNSMQSLISETNHVNEGVVTAMESLERSVKKVEETMITINSRVGILEDRIFDWQKFMHGLGSRQGLMVVGMICITIIILSLAIFAPESLPQFLDVVTAKAKG